MFNNKSILITSGFGISIDEPFKHALQGEGCQYWFVAEECVEC